jgi:hypothetical protein
MSILRYKSRGRQSHRGAQPLRQILYFWLLDHLDQVSAIRRLAASGMDEDTIVEVSALSLEEVRRALTAGTESVPA